jgi:hypothetical protein
LLEPDIGGSRFQTRADSAEGRSVAEAGDIYVVDRRPRRAMITDELSMRVDRAVGSVDYLYKRIVLDIFVRRVTPFAAGGRLRLDAAVHAIADRLAGLLARSSQAGRTPP